jgi:hypothetical protein
MTLLRRRLPPASPVSPPAVGSRDGRGDALPPRTTRRGLCRRRPCPTRRRAAPRRRKFGNLGSIQEQAREAHGWGWLERALKDLRFALRQLIKSPGFTLLAIVTLGLGIGANTSMFSVLNGILLKPLPYADSAQLDAIYRTTAQNPEGACLARRLPRSAAGDGGYGEIAAYAYANMSLSEPGQPAEMAALPRHRQFLCDARHPAPARPRFPARRGPPGNDRVVIISQRCWQNRFGGRADVIGRTVRVDGEPHEIVGRAARLVQRLAPPRLG